MRRLALVPPVAALVVTGLFATGCNASRRELTVVFTPASTPEQHAAAQRACTGAAPHTSPEPIATPSGTRGIERSGSLVQFRIDVANDQDLARLEECLQKQPGVQGFQDSSS